MLNLVHLNICKLYSFELVLAQDLVRLGHTINNPPASGMEWLELEQPKSEVRPKSKEIPGGHARAVDRAREVETPSEAVGEDVDHRFAHDLYHVFGVLSDSPKNTHIWNLPFLRKTYRQSLESTNPSKGRSLGKYLRAIDSHNETVKKLNSNLYETEGFECTTDTWWPPP